MFSLPPNRTARARALQIFVCLAVISLTPVRAMSEEQKSPGPEGTAFNVFDMPAMSEKLVFAFAAIKKGEFEDAEQSLRKIISEYPGRDQNYYLLATLLAARNKPDEALDTLSVAIDKGFRNSKLLQTDPNLKSLRDSPRFQELAEKIIKNNAEKTGDPGIKFGPYPIQNSQALVSPANTIWNPRIGTLISEFKFNATSTPSTVQTGTDPVANLLTQWYQRGSAAGNHGDLYDNRDRGHSAIKISRYPQFSFIEYSREAKDAGIDYGVNTKILFNSITIGNSSTAVTKGKFWRSQGRLATTLPFGANKLFLQYVSNHLYVYPAVADYGIKHGDILSANTPYMIISKGKSGSDRPFLNAVASILAAFKPEVKEYLKKNRMIMPTVQMIFREGQVSVKNPEDYLTYKAQPPVFDSLNIDLGKMVQMAQKLEIKDVPPIVQLSIVSESEPEKGIDDFSTFRPEALFSTPTAISRAVRSSALETKLVVSAEKTQGPPNQKLEYRWVVLRGDKKRISITPKNESGSVVEITVPWHAPFPAPEQADITTSRVEIGAFVNNGTYYSAPSFINFLFPANQVRKYNDKKQIVMIDHRSPETKGRYIDPQIFADRNWRDDYEYDAAGKLVGWTRTRGAKTERFTRDGARVIETDALDRPITAEKIVYKLEWSKSGLPVVTEQATDAQAHYVYANDNDRIGQVKAN